MTETRFTWQWLFAVAAIGMFIGLLFGLVVGWVALPVAGSGVDVSSLNAGAQNDYIILVANTFAYDGDLAKAKDRLTLLKDSKIASRVEILAKALNTRQDPSAANVADLAVQLGSTDSALQVLAASETNNPGTEPTKYAQVDVQPSSTPEPTEVSTLAPEATEAPTDEPTLAPTKKSITAAPKNTAKPAPPVPTNPPQQAAALFPEFKPGFPDSWPKNISFTPANVAPGQQYWHLTKATFCDVPPTNAPKGYDSCPGFPGGETDHTIYVAVTNADGSCATATVKHQINTGESPALEQKHVAYPWNSCDTDYEWAMYGEGNDIWIDGLPSDRMGSLVMNSPQLNWSGNRAHVRYFLLFQMTTR